MHLDRLDLQDDLLVVAVAPPIAEQCEVVSGSTSIMASELDVDAATFEETTMTGPVGSGPYRVTAVRPGASVTLTRNPDYWGRDLPVNRGLWNFDEVRLDFFREANGQFEAFKRGLYDFRVEHEPLRWHDGYDFPAARTGELIRDIVRPGLPEPSEFLVFNTRRPVFSDIRVRRALTLLFDFEWINRNYFFGLYGHAGGFFAGSELSAYQRAADDRERELLRPYAGAVAVDILDGSYRLAVTDASGRDRAALRAALSLLSEAGYDLDGTVLRQRATKAPLTFEILVTTRDQERIALAYQRDLRRAGIEATIRAVDPVQFDQRRLGYEFDMIQNRWDQSLSPGNAAVVRTGVRFRVSMTGCGANRIIGSVGAQWAGLSRFGIRVIGPYTQAHLD